MVNRVEEKALRLKCVYYNSNTVRKDMWVKVDSIEPIFGTDFPDIKGIKLNRDKENRPAEIKFTTSLFSYHNDEKYREKYSKFKNDNGFILVLSHDYLPKNFEKINNTDIYEIDRSDFTAFCRENFDRLLNRQIKLHTETKVWVMYQGPNFDKFDDKVKSARNTNIWCPTENLTTFDLAVGDRVLFIKTKGASSQDVQNNFDSVKDKWTLTEIIIAEVSSKIRSRLEYCQLKKIPYQNKLWVNDPYENDCWRWNRVFEFKIVKTLKKDILLYSLNNHSSEGFFHATKEVFCYRKSREISLSEYRDIIETLL